MDTICNRRSDHTAQCDLPGATGIIFAHNHFSGDPKPSRADIKAIDDLQKTAFCIGIRLQDHIISDSCYYSFTDKCTNAYDEALVKKLLQ